MNKSFSICNLAAPGTKDQLDRRFFPYGGTLTPLRTLFGILRNNGAKTVVIEDKYVDKDYQDEFSTFYCRAFRIYPQRCTRLHFFSEDIPETTLPKDLVKWKNRYLGFIVVRPTDLQRIGRTVLRPFIQDEHSEFVSCRAKFDVHILGESFTVEGMPFIQQDTQVGACAQASLWMLARYMSQRFGYREFLPGEINTLAKSRRGFGRHLPAEWGLDLSQMLDALAGMGYAAVVYARPNIDACSPHINNVFVVDPNAPLSEQHRQKHIQQTAKMADITYRYVESGLPVILCTANHAMVAVGHVYSHTVNATLSIERIPAFIVNNDAAGPYGRMPLVPPNPGEVSFFDITEIIVVVPPEVTLRGEEAETMAIGQVRDFLDTDFDKTRKWKEVLAGVRPEFTAWFARLEFRTYLRPSVEWQQDLRTCLTADPKRNAVAERLLALDYPKYVWVTEISSSPLLNQATKDKRQCLGCVVVDSTAPARTRGTIAMHFADVLVIHDRQTQDTVEKPEVRHINGSTPFLHKVW